MLGGETGNVAGNCNTHGSLKATGATSSAPAPLDLQQPGRAAGRASVRHHALHEPAEVPPARLPRPAVRRPARSRLGHGAAVRAAGVRLRRLRAGPCGSAPVQLQLENLHRGLPRGLPRRPVPSGPGPLRHLRRPGEFNDWYSLQKVGVHNALAQPGSEVYKQWHDRLLSFREGDAPDFGAVWVTYFPTHMIELYPHVLVLSTLYPKSPQETVNVVEFYYPRKSPPSSASSSRRSARPTWKRRSRTTRSPNAWTPAARPDAARRERDRPVPVAHGRRHAALP